MTQPGVFTPYSSVSPLFGAPESWVPARDQERIASYQTYDELYWNQNDKIQILTRAGVTEETIIVPTPMIIVETINRYVGTKLRPIFDEASGTPASRETARLAFTSLFARERFVSKYNSNKRFGLVRGDWMFHVLGDPSKPQGSRLRIIPVDPAAYFPIEDENDPERLLGCHLVERILVGDDIVVKRQTYRREQDSNGNFTGVVTSETTLWKQDEWFLLDKNPLQVLSPLTPLPAGIAALPVYHIPNFDEPGNRFGSSEMRGFERLMAGINGSLTDEDVTLALEGLGVYFTESAKRPVNESGEVVDWDVFPGKVIQGTRMERVQGVGSVQPFGDHIERMLDLLKQASAATDAATGRVDVQVAESGVALLLHFSPTLAKAEEKDQIIKDVLGQMFFDLRTWLRVYEGVNIDDVMVLPAFGDKLPVNTRQAVEMMTMLMSTNPPIISAQSARSYLSTRGGLGEVFADNEGELVAAEQESALAVDDRQARAAGELGADTIGSEADAAAGDGGEG